MKSMESAIGRPEQESDDFLPMENLGMYEVSGQDKITKHSFDRYLKDKQQDDFIRKYQETADSFKEQMSNALSEEKVVLIRKALNAYNVKEKRIAVGFIDVAPIEERADLIRQALSDSDFKTQQIVAAMMDSVSSEKEFDVLKKVVADNIKRALNSSDLEVQRAAAQMITHVSGEEIANLIQQALENPDWEVKKIASSQIYHCTGTEEDVLRKVVAYNIRRALNGSDLEAKETAIKMISVLSGGDRLDLLKQALGDSDFKTQLIAVSMMRCVYFSKEFKKMVVDKIERALNSSDLEAQRTAAQMINYLPTEEKRELFDLAITKDLGEELVKPPLYLDAVIDKKSLVRKKFVKTGSETTLVGGSLKEKAIIRHIEPQPFFAWQRLYENNYLWREAGFDYVPIEPIVSYRFNERQGLIDVYSGVLDLSLGIWLERTGKFNVELNNIRDRILKVLDKLKIKHGHTHDNNFCLRFFRDENGQIDFNRVPRLYLIDFDQAVSP